MVVGGMPSTEASSLGATGCSPPIPLRTPYSSLETPDPSTARPTISRSGCPARKKRKKTLSCGNGVSDTLQLSPFYRFAEGYERGTPTEEEIPMAELTTLEAKVAEV